MRWLHGRMSPLAMARRFRCCWWATAGAVQSRNLAAAEIDDCRAGTVTSSVAGADSLAGIDRVYAYTFASPATTLNAQAHDARYANIFNIANPSDIMPYLPLRTWGYERYGIDKALPAVDAEGFDELRTAMERLYEQSVGVACGADPSDKHVSMRC